LTRVERKSSNQEGEKRGNPEAKRSRIVHQTMISTMAKATGRPSARSLRLRRVLENRNPLLLGPNQCPSYATMGVVCLLLEAWVEPYSSECVEGVFSEVRGTKFLKHSRYVWCYHD
jgi:hypothetical protein